MTKEYISRDEMIEQTKARIVLGAPKFNTGLKAAIEVATSIPAADVMEVRHGQKIDITNIDDFFPWCKCSVCGYNGLFIEDEYCSHCGAKLDVPVTNGRRAE